MEPHTTGLTEQYTIRRKILKFFGAGFHIYDEHSGVVGYCDQKAFRLREDLRIYTDDARSEELFRIHTRQVIDFGATYEVRLPGEALLGSFRRSGVKSLLRDTWSVLDPAGGERARVIEESPWKAAFRRLNDGLAAVMPQRFLMHRLTETGEAGELIASYRTHFNPFVYRLGVRIDRADQTIDDLMILAGGCLLAAIEGRQD
jgi:uncharacterized protein YxjI